MLKPNSGNRHIAIITKKLITTALNLEILKSSMVPAIELSNTAIMVDTAAINMNRKNNVPHKEPKDIFENTTVIVKNSKLGPASGLIP